MSVFNVGFVIFPDLTQLDFTGPQQVLARLPESAMHIVAKSAAPVPSDSGLGLVPTHTFENCPRLDLICVPGGIAGVGPAPSFSASPASSRVAAPRPTGPLPSCCPSLARRMRRAGLSRTETSSPLAA